MGYFTSREAAWEVFPAVFSWLLSVRTRRNCMMERIWEFQMCLIHLSCLFLKEENWRQKVGEQLLRTEVGNFFWKGPESRYFRLCRPGDLCLTYSTLPSQSEHGHGWYVSWWAWPCPDSTLFTKQVSASEIQKEHLDAYWARFKWSFILKTAFLDLLFIGKPLRVSKHQNFMATSGRSYQTSYVSFWLFWFWITPLCEWVIPGSTWGTSILGPGDAFLLVERCAV